MRRQGPLRYCLAAFRADSTKLARQKNIDTIYSSACPEFITYWITFRSEGRVYHKLSARQRRGLGLAGCVTLCVSRFFFFFPPYESSFFFSPLHKYYSIPYSLFLLFFFAVFFCLGAFSRKLQTLYVNCCYQSLR